MSELSDAFDSLTNSVINAANVVIAADTSKRDRKFAEHMYERQVEDNRKNWEMQNQYNSPKAQMARLEAAGLNPNLVYGTGAVGNSTGVPAGSSLPSYHSTVVPQLSNLQFNQMALATKAMRAEIEGKQLDNSLKALEVNKEEANKPYYEDNARLINEQLSTAVDTAWHDRNIKEAQAYIDQVNKAFVQYTTGIDVPFSEDEAKFEEWKRIIGSALEGSYGQDFLAKLQLTPTALEKAKADVSYVFKQISHLGQQIVNLQKQGKLIDAQTRKTIAEADYQEYETEMIKNGINIKDPIWARSLAYFLEGFTNGQGLSGLLNKIGGNVNQGLKIAKDVLSDDAPIEDKTSNLLKLFLMWMFSKAKS